MSDSVSVVDKCFKRNLKVSYISMHVYVLVCIYACAHEVHQFVCNDACMHLFIHTLGCILVCTYVSIPARVQACACIDTMLNSEDKG